MPATRLPNYAILRHFMQDDTFRKVWNALIPAAAVKFELLEDGVRYLHATKGWKFVGKRRFAVRGVL